MEAGALWARQRIKGVDGPIRAYLAYLASESIDEFPVTAEDCLKAEEVIRGDMESMTGCLEDPEMNIPCPEEVFPRQKNRKFCDYCEFQEICFNPMYESD